MLNSSIRILNFDDSITRQNGLTSSYETEIIDLRDIGTRVRFWMNVKDREEIAKRILSSDKSAITFLGSGDFHQISNILISAFSEPISVIDFDFHPDWHILPPRFSCGSWVAETLKNDNILKYVMVGISSDDLSTLSIQGGDFNALKDDRLEIYPCARKPSTVFFRKIPQNISMKIGRSIFTSTIYWNELNNKNLMEFFLHILKRLPTKKVYLTIDKDCLKSEHALTNWEEGRLPLEDLLLMLRLIKENLEIVGVDIVGDYSDIHIKGVIKNTVSYFNHPKRFSAKNMSGSYATKINEDTNLKLMGLLTS